VAVAAFLKESTDVPNGWLADQLNMGSPFYVSKHVGLLRRSPAGEAGRWLAHLRAEIGKEEHGGPRQLTGDLEKTEVVRAPNETFVVDFSSRERDDGSAVHRLE
jgi:hypothetical protein